MHFYPVDIDVNPGLPEGTKAMKESSKEQMNALYCGSFKPARGAKVVSEN